MARKVTAPASEKPKKPVAKPRSATHSSPARSRTRPATVTPPEAPAFNIAEHQAEVSEAAYYLWLARNGQHGAQQEDWLEAEAMVRAKYA
jgi:DUF2934 family protein